MNNYIPFSVNWFQFALEEGLGIQSVRITDVHMPSDHNFCGLSCAKVVSNGMILFTMLCKDGKAKEVAGFWKRK